MYKRSQSRVGSARIAGMWGVVVCMALYVRGENVTTPLLAINAFVLIYVARGLRQLRASMPVASTISAVAADQHLFSALRRITTTCSVTVEITDGLHRALMLDSIQNVVDEAEAAAAGKFHFESTDRWRASYEQLLTSPGLHVYRSVAIVRTPSYWQTEAGIKSIQLNHQLSESERLTIERVVVLTDELWPDRNALPVEKIQEWLIEQHHHGISLWLVRESELSGESDLLVDMGIYGSRAIGIQELDDHGNTRQFTLRFGLEHVTQAEERWQRLLVYAVKYSDFLDRYTITS